MSKTTTLFTMDQVAKIAGCSVQTVRRRISDGSLRAVRLGPRSIRIPADAVEEMLKPIGVA